MTLNKNLAEDAIAVLSDSEKRELIFEFETFVCCGEIGDCKLRQIAQKLCEQTAQRGNSVEYMTKLGCACYKYFAKQYLDMSKD